MSRPKLELDLDLDEEDTSLNINNAYAKNYEEWRKKEELQKFKDKYGTDDLNELDGEESDSESSVDFVKWTADDERDFLKTLGALKSKDPKIYQNDVKFFNEREEEPVTDAIKPKKQKKEKAMTLRDYEQKLVLERGGELSDVEDEHATGPSYSEQEAQLKQDLKNAINNLSGNESEEDDGLLKKRVKTVEEIKAEEDECHEWLKGHRQEIEGVDEDLKSLKKQWDEPELDSGEKFLRDYILNKQYETDIDPSAIGEEFCPSYDDTIRDEDDEAKQSEFEVKYNFRYEEPDQDFIKQFPRTVAESVRKADTRRKEARDRRNKRHEEEKREREEDIRQIKAIQKSEMAKKLKKLRELADNDIPFDIDDLNKDFDPEEHDRKMKHFDDNMKCFDEEGFVEESKEPTTSAGKKKKSKSELEFRYRPVEPNDYGLSTDEILKLDDRQLNAWVSTKKVTAYRTKDEEFIDQRVYSRKAQDVERKNRVFSSIPPKLPKTVKKEVDHTQISSEPLNTGSRKNRHRKRKTNLDLDTNRLHAYGVRTQTLKSELFKKKKMSK